MGKVEFDKIYWPESGTIIKGPLPYDLNDLWEKYAEQATVFVAQALIDEPPTISFQLTSDADIEVFLWTVGGDTLVVRESLSKLIDGSDAYDRIRSDEQKDDVIERLAGLEDVAAAILKAKEVIQKQLDDYEKEKAVG